MPILAVGAYSKTTVALAWDDRAVVSPHIGDLASPRGREVFVQVAGDLQELYGVRAARIAHDAHPHFPNTRWARQSGLPTCAVWHHCAHAAAVAGEYPSTSPLLCFTWDGIGLGPDGTLWGGEALLGRPGRGERVASWRPFRLPGGERAAREPWRSALALSWESGLEWPEGAALADPVAARGLGPWPQRPGDDLGRPLVRSGRGARGHLLARELRRRSGDAPGGSVHALAPAAPVVLPLERDAGGIWRSDWAPLVPMLLNAHTASGRPRRSVSCQCRTRLVRTGD